MGNACDADGVAQEWRNCGVGEEGVRDMLKLISRWPSWRSLASLHVACPFVVGSIDLKAVLGEHFDEVGVALERITAQIWDTQTAPVDEGES
jgi:hypothetical protein